MIGVGVTTEGVIRRGSEQPYPVEGFDIVPFYRNYDIHPDGDRFVMVFPDDQTDSAEPFRPTIIVVLNWFEELKERVPVP